MANKTEQLQLRVTPAEKQAIRERAEAAGLDLSTYVLHQALPRDAFRFQKLIDRLEGEDTTYVLAEVNDFLTGLSEARFVRAVGSVRVDALRPYLRNYVAAMVELAAQRLAVELPAWTAQVRPLDTPRFGAPLKSLRPYLLRVSPPAFKRRNIFVDASLGDRV